MNPSQLVLISNNRSKWLLDEKTKRVGRQGLAQARAVLLTHGLTTVNDHETLPAAA